MVINKYTESQINHFVAELMGLKISKQINVNRYWKRMWNKNVFKTLSKDHNHHNTNNNNNLSTVPNLRQFCGTKEMNP